MRPRRLSQGLEAPAIALEERPQDRATGQLGAWDDGCRVDATNGSSHELTVPARAQYLYLVRLHVGAVAARLDMTLEVIEDLHLAAEALHVAAQPFEGHPDHLTVGITWDDDALEIGVPTGGPAA